jgi:nicotinamidase-related amidase
MRFVKRTFEERRFKFYAVRILRSSATYHCVRRSAQSDFTPQLSNKTNYTVVHTITRENLNFEYKQYSCLSKKRLHANLQLSSHGINWSAEVL